MSIPSQPQATRVGGPAATPAVAPGAGGTGIISRIMQTGPGFNVVQYQDGRIERRTGSRNWRNNNPGNLEFGDFSRRYGALGSDGRFAIFPTYEAGQRAKEALLFEGRGYSGMNIAQAITRYAPPNENDTNMYIRTVSNAVRLSPTTPMNTLNPEQRRILLAAMERVEGFRVGRIDIIQPGDPNAAPTQQAIIPAAGQALAQQGAQMAAADQAQRMGVGRTIEIRGIPQSVQAPVNIPGMEMPIQAASGEVSLERRLQNLVN
jgi:hypothetical protein